MSKAIREVTLRAFSIKSTKMSSDTDEFFESIKEKLNTTSAKERLMVLNQDDDTAESDLISYFSLKDNNIFATMMRIAPGADDRHIDNELMEKNSFSVSEIRRTKNNAAALYKNHYYICFNNNYLVTNLPQTTTIKRIETYLNWLIDSHTYEITPVVSPYPDLKLSDLKTVVFKNKDLFHKKISHDPENIEDKIIDLKNNFITNFFKTICVDSDTLNDIDINQIISAELLLKLSKPRKMSEEEFQKTYGAILKPVSDSENIVFKDNKGNRITGEDLLKTKKVNIERTDQGFLQEPQLHIEMAKFIDELML